MIKDFIYIIGLILARSYQFILLSLGMIGLMTVHRPIVMVVGFGIFVWLVNHVSWYLELWLWLWLLPYTLFLVSEKYREWTYLAYDMQRVAVWEKYS